MDKNKIKKIRNIEDLCNFFGIVDIEYRLLIVSQKQGGKDSDVKKIILRKKSGGIRTVYKIQNHLKHKFIKKINNFLNENFIFNECVQGFVPKRNIKTNAKKHLNKRLIINADVKNFFDSIKEESVFELFKTIGFKKVHSKFLTKLVTFEGKLAQGFSTSPMIANIIFGKVDNDFIRLAKEKGYTYTRYADDLTFSTNSFKLISFDEINQILQKHDFSLNYKKNKIQKKGGVQYVTGLTVCDDKIPRLPRYLKKNMRLELHYINKYGLIEHYKKRAGKKTIFDFLYTSSIYGWVRYIRGIEPAFANYLIEKIESIEEKGFVTEYLEYLDKQVNYLYDSQN